MIEVILEPADTPDSKGRQRYFVMIKGIPHATGRQVLTHALLLEKAEKIQRDVEDALDKYRRPARKARKAGRTVWKRLLEG